MKNYRQLTKKGGFTIIELLTVMAVIAILIGLLVPALNKVQDYAKEIKQRGQFHSIDVGMQTFRGEVGFYPPSSDNFVDVDPRFPDSHNYGGAQKLAEALVGWDLLGFHPKSDFRSHGTNDFDGDGTADLVYDAKNGITGSIPNPYTETAEQNIRARKGPYIELENANAYRMEDVYGPANVGNFGPSNIVLCDVYSKKRISGKKTGMPILYYRARTPQYSIQDYTDTQGIKDDIYNYQDNEALLMLRSAEDNTVFHPLADNSGSSNLGADSDLKDFETMILNPQVQKVGHINRPYKSGTYILLSAGPDGLYGNGDDIFNFIREEQ